MFGYTLLTPSEYKEMQDKIGHYTYSKVYKYYGILDRKTWYKHQPKPSSLIKEG